MNATTNEHDLSIRTIDELEQRLIELYDPVGPNHDHRCGCAEDGYGRLCNWDDYDAVESELAGRFS